MSPALHTLVTAIKIADIPDEADIAAAPPSKAATFFSSASQVGLPKREYIYPGSLRSNTCASCSGVS